MSSQADGGGDPTPSGGGRAGARRRTSTPRLNPEDRPLGAEGCSDALAVGGRAALHGDRPAHRRGAGAPSRAARGCWPTSAWASTTSTSTRRRRTGSPSRNTPDVLTDATADIAMTLLLTVTRRAGEGERHAARGRVDRMASHPHARHPGERQDARPRGHGPDRARGRQAGASWLRHEGHLPRPLSAAARCGRARSAPSRGSASSRCWRRRTSSRSTVRPRRRPGT